ncbi:MAG: hypothetical protein K0S01_2777 [Herbinix sp.]|jgi:hypothetical protein|nr:hypothetical protein [Herbinix sp.]
MPEWVLDLLQINYERIEILMIIRFLLNIVIYNMDL